MLDAEIVIVGAGPAGLSTALFLAARAPAVVDRLVVIDKARHPREKICAGAVGGRADRRLASIGVHVDVPSAILRGVGVRTRDGELVLRGDAPIGRVVKRRAFDDALARAARARGITIREGAGLRTLTPIDRGFALTLDDGDVVRARFVVGADGVTSTVRRALGIDKGALMAQAAEVDTAWRATDGPRDVAMFDLTRPGLRGYTWDFPTPSAGGLEVCRGVYQLREGAVATRTNVDDVLREHVGDVPTSSPVRRFAERGLSPHEPMAKGRAMLVGEAAGIDPVLGEGIAQAILYGATAGTFLADAIARGAKDLERWPEAVRAERIGLDLRARTAAVPLVYGRGRPLLERWVATSPALCRVGMAYFAGEHVPRGGLAEAFVDLARAATYVARARMDA